MIEVVNVVACLVMLLIAALVAIEMPHRGMWLRRAVLWLLLAALAAEATNPWAAWLPAATWPSAIVHALVAVVVLAWRAELWALLRAKFSAPHGLPWGRRSTDYADFDSQPASDG